MQQYTPSLHILSTFQASSHHLKAMSACQHFFDGLIEQLGLQKVGATYYAFDGGGFTAVVCLTESHVSIHTWPEFEIATFDVFLSNFCKDNTEKVHEFYNRTLTFFHATELNKHEVIR